MTLPHATGIFGGLSETHASSAVPEISTVVLNGGGSSVSEGGTATFNVSTVNIPDATSLTWVVTHGTTAAADFTSTTGTVTITSNSGSFGVPTVADNTTEGNETFTVSVTGNVSGTAVSKSSTSITVLDTSQDPSTPQITSFAASPTAIYEGGAASTITLATSDIPNGTQLNWEIANGTNTTNADFTASSGTVTINSNAATISVSAVDDATRNAAVGQTGSDTFGIRIYGTVGGNTVDTTSALTICGIRDETPVIHNIVVPTSVNEGSSANITVEHYDIPTATSMSWELIGSGGSPFSNADFSNSSGTVNSGGDGGSTTLDDTTIISIAPINDNTTEGAETGFIRVSGTSGGVAFTKDSGVFTINDTSTTPPSVDSVTGPSSVNEGAAATINVSTTNIPDGTTLSFTVNHGTSSAADMNVSSGNVTINSNAGAFALTMTADSTTEGSETFTVTVSGTVSGTAVSATSSAITINDTSTTPAQPAINSVTGPTTVNEGSSATINVVTSNIGNGNTLSWSINHSSTASADFGSTSGTVNVSSNAASFTIPIVADSTTEGNETFTVSVAWTVPNGGQGESGTSGVITISDTSQTPAPTYSVTAPASVNEGATGSMSVTTTNVTNGTTLYWTVTPSADFGTTSGSFTVNSNAGSFTVSPTADSTTEGAETGTIAIRTGSTSGTIVATDTFTINDTSTTPVPTYAISAPSSIDEGSSGSFTVTTTNVTNGTVLYFTMNLTGDFASPSGTVAINSNTGSFSRTPTADTTTEGAETCTVSLRTGSTSGTIVATDTFTINDTSTTPPTYSIAGPATLNEGATGTMTVTTTNVANGTTLYWLAGPASDFNTDIGTLTINSNSGTFTITPTADNTTEGTETATIRVYDDAGRTNQVTGRDVDIIDTSTTPPTYAVTAPASINEGSAGTINVTTTNVADSTALYWSVSTGDSPVDFSTSTGTVTITSNAGSFTVTPDADTTTEGSETATITLRTGSQGGTIVATDTFTINDTSQTPAPTYAVTAPASIDEGVAGTMNVTTTNVADSTTLYWSVEPAGDFSTSSGSFSISSNAGSFTATPTADSTTEGAETGTIRIRTGSTSGTIVASDTFTINDTSTAPSQTLTCSNGNNFTLLNQDNSTSETFTATGLNTSGTYNLVVPNPTVTSGSLLCEFSSFFYAMTHQGGGTWTANVRLDRTGTTVGTGSSLCEVKDGFTSLSPTLTRTVYVVQSN